MNDFLTYTYLYLLDKACACLYTILEEPHLIRPI